MNPQNPTTPSAPAGGTGAAGDDTGPGGTLTDTKNKITQTAKDAAAKVKTVAADTAAKAREKAERVASEKKENVASRVGDYSSAIHESAKSIEQKDPNIAWFTHRAADRLQGVADYMRNQDFGALRTDVEGFARRHPAAFFGGLFFAGLMLGNVVKASRRKLEDESTDAADQAEAEWAAQSRGNFDSQAELTEAERSAAGI